MTTRLRKLDLILDTITDGVLVVDSQGVVLYANQAAETLLARNPLIGQSLAIPVNPDKSSHQDINLIRPNGLAWAEMRSAPIEWDGQPGYVIALRDITERKHMELERQKFVSLAENSLDFIGICDMNLRPFYINEAGMRLIGLDNLDQCARTPIQVLLPRRPALHPRRIFPARHARGTRRCGDSVPSFQDRRCYLDDVQRLLH